MIEQRNEEIADPLLENRLSELGREGWIPWSKNPSGTPGSDITYTTVWFWRIIPILLLLFLLVGCAASQPVLNLGTPQAVSVPDKTGLRHTYSYVAIKSGSTLLDHTMGFSIYDEDAKHILTNVTPIQGFLGAVGEAATQSAVPTASFIGPLIK